jgi:hypothetical protein
MCRDYPFQRIDKQVLQISLSFARRAAMDSERPEIAAMGGKNARTGAHVHHFGRANNVGIGHL